MFYHAYCVYCKRGQENKLIRILQKIAPSCRVIRPAKRKKIMRDGNTSELAQSLCPRYLFLYSNEAIGKVLHDKYLPGIEYWLGDKDNDYELLDADLVLAQALYACNGIFDE